MISIHYNSFKNYFYLIFICMCICVYYLSTDSNRAQKGVSDSPGTKVIGDWKLPEMAAGYHIVVLQHSNKWFWSSSIVTSGLNPLAISPHLWKFRTPSKIDKLKKKTERRLSRVDLMSQSQHYFGGGIQTLSQAIFLKQNMEVPKTNFLRNGCSKMFPLW